MESVINPTQINVYGINSFINKLNTKEELINLDLLKEVFKIDFTFDDDINQIEESDLPAFTQLSYNERIISGDTRYSTSYNRPPLGPIENFCYCYNCNNSSPEYHKMDCPYPEKKSLLLTLEGIYYYIVNSTYDGNLNELKEAWNNQNFDIFNKFLIRKNSISIKNGEIFADKNVLTNISYLDVVKKRGPAKIEYSTATTKFSNNIFLTYELDNNKKTSIRISKNGLINLINVPYSKELRDNLYSKLIDRININSSEYINLKLFNELTKSEYNKYSIIENMSYVHSMNSQFNLWQIKDKYSIDFNKLDELISPYNSSGRLVDGEFTVIETIKNKQIINVNSPINKIKIKIINWEFSEGKETKYQTITREEIKCIIIPESGIKISLQIHKHGTFQMSMSYCNLSDINNNICNNTVNHNLKQLDTVYFEKVRNVFSEIFKTNTNLFNLSLDYSEEDFKSAKNTVSGNSPPKRPGSTTEVCRSRDPRPGFPGMRPLPYSWKGKCPESRQYLDFMGVLGNDNLYYPCCAAKSKKSEEIMKEYLISGFPKNKSQEIEYRVNSKEDLGSGILVPGSLSIGSITKVLINGIYKDVEIISFKGVKPKIFTVKELDTGNIITVNRDSMKRDSRYFPGLKSFSKEQLINCIIRNIKSNNEIKSIFNLNNLTEIKSLIDIQEYLSLSFYNINSFEILNYYVTSVPEKSENYYLVITPESSYFINNYGVKKSKSLIENIGDTIIFNGYLYNDKYYVIDLLYHNRKMQEQFKDRIRIMNDLETTYFISDDKIEFSVFETNVIKSSAELILESKDIYLIFVPENGSIKTWYNSSPDNEIVLQLISKTKKTNYYTLGFDNTQIKDFDLDFNKVFISKEFIQSNNIKINDFIFFIFDYNIQTGLLSTRPLSPIEKVKSPDTTLDITLNTISLLLNPIKESFFINNKLGMDYIWMCPDKILKFVNDNSPLIIYN